MVSRNRILLVCCMGCVMALGAGAFATHRFLRTELHGKEIAAQPPVSLFQDVFGISPPTNIDGMRVAGIAGGLSGNAWMRLHVTDIDAVLRQLRQRTKGLVGPDKTIGEAMQPPDISERIYAQEAGWEEVQRVKQPEYYAYPPKFNGTGWQADIVVDRERKLLFVAAKLF